MEEVYNTFFLWYALKGQPRTPPPYRLVVVLIDTPSNSTKVFQSKHAAFNFVPMVGGGFTAQRDNVLVLASRRMDEAFEKLNDYNQSKWEDYNTSQAELLTNVNAFLRNPKVVKGQQSGKPAVAIVSMMQTFALCQKAMNEESELVALTHGGVRQLMAATGIMPRNVDTAEWARFGLASFFEVPMQSFHPSTGAPNWAHLVEFRALRKAKVLETKDAKDILLKVISDQYFHQAYATLKHAELASKEDRDDVRHKGQDELELARATSWSLTYYLARHKSQQLERYFGELRSLPRRPGLRRQGFARLFLPRLRFADGRPGKPRPSNGQEYGSRKPGGRLVRHHGQSVAARCARLRGLGGAVASGRPEVGARPAARQRAKKIRPTPNGRSAGNWQPTWSCRTTRTPDWHSAGTKPHRPRRQSATASWQRRLACFTSEAHGPTARGLFPCPVVDAGA